MDFLIIYDAVIRGACAGLFAFSGLSVLRHGGSRTRKLFAVFLLFASAYPLISSPMLWAAMGTERYILRVFANLAIVPLWMALCSAFDDDFRWRPWRFIPLALLLAVIISRALRPDAWGASANVIQHAVTLGLMAHLLWLILSRKEEDLDERRRNIRNPLAFSLIGLVVFIALGELTNILSHSMAGWMSLLHVGILLVTFGVFALKVFRVEGLFGEVKVKAPDQAAFSDPVHEARLEQAMADGMYRDEGLKVGALAHRLNMSEHHLRKLINSGLGYRNFPSYLNALRIKDAKVRLADPSNRGQQILQIALDLGYGSIGPFNRAFKSETDMTPTAYRNQAQVTSD